MPKLCICKICTCGRHKCPHNPTGLPRSTEPCTFSEYANQYQAHPLEARKSYKPEQTAAVSNGPMDDKTTNRVDYIQHALAERVPHKQEKYKQPEGDMDMLTNYHKEFTQKPMEPNRPMRRVEVPKVSGKFEGEPTYASDYREWEVKPRERGRADQGSYQPPEIPFDGSTNYQAEFLPKKIELTRTMKPTEQARNNDDPFDGDTHYRQDYVKHALPIKEVKEKVVWRPNEAPLDDLSHYRKDFMGKSGDKGVSYKPDAVPYNSQAPFMGDTTQKVDYVAWPTEKRDQREKEVYRKPDGDFDMNTTTRVDYVAQPFERQSIMRPVELKKIPGKFDDTTNYKQEYRKWTPTGDRYQRVKEEYTPTDAPFEGLATYQTDYLPYRAAQPAKSLKPAAEQHINQGPMADATEYKKEFYRKEAAPCPAALIESGKDVLYRFANRDDDGHHWFDFARSTLVGGRI